MKPYRTNASEPGKIEGFWAAWWRRNGRFVAVITLTSISVIGVSHGLFLACEERRRQATIEFLSLNCSNPTKSESKLEPCIDGLVATQGSKTANCEHPDHVVGDIVDAVATCRCKRSPNVTIIKK